MIVMVVLLAVAVVAVQVVLQTDLPQRWVLGAISEQLGAKVTAGSLRTSFWGKTTVKDFALNLPMEENEFLRIPEISLSHTAPPLLVLGRSLTCHSVRIVNPTVNVRRDDAGRWNVEQLASCLRQVMANTRKQRKVNLPELDVVDGALIVINSAGDIESMQPVNFHGKPAGPARWDFEMNIPSRVAISGKLTAGTDWTHEVNFDFRDLDKLAAHLMPGSPKPLCARGTLYGHIRHSELIGNVQLQQLQCGPTQARGTVGIEISQDKLLGRFENLLIQESRLPVEEVRLAGGSVQWAGQQLQADHVLVEAGGVQASVTGHWDRTTGEAALTSSWTGEIDKRPIHHEGTLTGSASWPRMGRKQVNVSVAGFAKSPSHDWRGDVEIQGSGSSLSASQWQVSAPRLSWQDKRTAGITLENVRAEIDVNWPDIRLASLSAANAEHLKAEGNFSADQRSWTLSFDAEGVRAVREQSRPVDLTLVADGDREQVNVKKFMMIRQNLSVQGSGTMALPSTELRDAHAETSWMIRPANGREGFDNVSGNLQCEVDITGTARPVNLQLQSMLSGESITFNKNVVGKIKIPCHMQIATRGAEFKAGPFKLFGGTWNMAGEHDFSRQVAQLAFDANQVSLEPVAGLFELPLKCQGSMMAHLEISLPLYDVNQVAVSGGWNVQDLIMPPIEADSAEGQVDIRNGKVVLDRIHLKRNLGLASASAQFHLDQPQYVSVEVAAEQWPTNLPDRNMTFVTDGRADAVLDLARRTAEGKGTLSTSVVIDQQEFGHISAEIAAEGRTVHLNSMEIEVLGGSAGGTAQIPLDSWLGSRIELQWQNLEMAALADWWTELEGLSGRCSGSLTAARADDRRALEPLHIQIRAGVADGDFRGARIGDYQISAYLGDNRLLIDESEFEIMNGTLSASGSLRRSVNKGSVYYIRGGFSQLELDQLVHSFLPSAKPIEGRLSGKGMLVVLSDLRGMTGRADVQLSDVDLGRTILVSTLYDALNLKFGSHQPTGQGQISMRFEGSSLKIPSFTYFNRGAEIRGACSVDDLTRGKMSPVSGYAIGSARPLKGIRLPGIEDLDRLIASLQTGVSSVRIDGTLAEPAVTPVAFREVGQALRVLLWNQLGE